MFISPDSFRGSFESFNKVFGIAAGIWIVRGQIKTAERYKSEITARSFELLASARPQVPVLNKCEFILNQL